MRFYPPRYPIKTCFSHNSLQQYPVSTAPEDLWLYARQCETESDGGAGPCVPSGKFLTLHPGLLREGQ